MSGFFNQLGRDLKYVGKEVTRGIDDAAKSADKTLNEHWSSPLLDMFRTSNVVQMVSNRSGRTLQIVQSTDGRLVVDGCGPEGPTVYNTHWTVTNFGKNVISLQNQTNFLAIRDGMTQIAHVPDPAMLGPDCKFRLVQTGNFMMFESVAEPRHHIGVLQNGQLKSAIATGREADAHFGVRLIYSPHPPPAAVAHGPRTQTVVVTSVPPKGGAYAPPPYSK